MIFNKSPDISYTEMAIYVDEHIYEDSCDELKCYEYIYHLCMMLANKKRFFNTPYDYENYSIFAASKIFSRYKNPKQKSGKLPHIKSCLNYIKKIAYPLKVDYQQQEFAERFQPASMSAVEVQNIRQDLVTRVLNMDTERIQTEVTYYLSTLSRIIKDFLYSSPYRCDKLMLHRLYLSCCLSLLRMITLNKASELAVEKKITRPNEHLDTFVEQSYREESTDQVILFHLDESMRNYVQTLVMKIKRLISKDILFLSDHHDLSEDIICDVLKSPLTPTEVANDDCY